MSKRHLYSHVHCSIIYNERKRGRERVYCIYRDTTTLIINETVSFVTTWMNLEHITLRPRKTNPVWSHLYVDTKTIKLMETREQNGGSQGLEGRGMGLVKGCKFFITQEKHILEIYYTTWWLQIILYYILDMC
jgi:hypothetical protein